MAEVIFASSYDEKNPPSNIFSSNKKEFFSSTGMFPQELCIQFETEKIVKEVAELPEREEDNLDKQQEPEVDALEQTLQGFESFEDFDDMDVTI